MVHHVITNDYVEAPIVKGQRLAHGGDSRSTILPTRKEVFVTYSERIDTDSVLRAKVKD